MGNCRSVKCLYLCFGRSELVTWNHDNIFYLYNNVKSLEVSITDRSFVCSILPHFQELRRLFIVKFFDERLFRFAMLCTYHRDLEVCFWGYDVEIMFNGRIVTLKKFHSDVSTDVRRIDWPLTVHKYKECLNLLNISMPTSFI
jgi:hypothetical protein